MGNCCEPEQHLAQNANRRNAPNQIGVMSLGPNQTELANRQMKTQNSCIKCFIKQMGTNNKLFADYIDKIGYGVDEAAANNPIKQLIFTSIQTHFLNEKEHQLRDNLIARLKETFSLIVIVQQKQIVFLSAVDILTNYINSVFQNFENRNKRQAVIAKKELDHLMKSNKYAEKLVSTIVYISNVINKMEKKYLFAEEELEKSKEQNQKLRLNLDQVKQDNSNKKDKIAQLQEQFINENKRYSVWVIRLEEELNNFRLELMKKDEIIQNMRKEATTHQCRTEESERMVFSLPPESKKEDEKNIQLSSELSKPKDQLQQLKARSDKTISEKDSKISELQAQNVKKGQIIRELNAKNSSLDRTNKQMAAEITKLKDSNQNLLKDSIAQNESIVKSRSEVNNLKDLLESQKEILDEKDRQNQNLQSQMNKIRQENEKLQNEFNYFKAKMQSELTKIQHLERENQELKQRNDKQTETIDELNRKVDNLEQEKQSLALKIQQKTEELMKIESIKEESTKKDKEISELKELNMKISQQISSSRFRSKSFVEQKTLFYGALLEKRAEEKKYLIRSIQKQMKKQIEKTTLLYEFKRDKARNFHELVDNKSNLIVIVETDKVLLAGYYSGQLQEKAPMIDEAMLISITNRQYYTLKKEQPNNKKQSKDRRLMRGMTYDKFYLIFGNAELRIKTGDDKIFSNFAISSAFFENRKDKVDALLNQGTVNEVPLITYEIYEIIFEVQMMQMMQEMVQE